MKATEKIIRIRHKRKSLQLRSVWLDAYDKALAKPQWSCDDAAYGLQKHELSARRDADVAVFYSKLG